MDRMRLYDITYALAAGSGREAALFGDCGPAAREAFARSLASGAFPELWFEIPLAGDPWLDFHALVSHRDMAGAQASFAGHGGAYADALSWFAGQGPGRVRQLALSYDTSSGDVEHPAVQLLVNAPDPSVPLEFLEAAGRPDLRGAYAGFIGAMPPEWYACYVGIFPGRNAAGADPWVRVECIVGDSCQRAYTQDAGTLRDHLTRIGIRDADALGTGLVAGVQALARSPFPLELQFNIGAEGKALPALSASVRFQPQDWNSDEGRVAIGRLAGWLQERGLADGRCALLPQTVFAKRAQRDSESSTITCFPAFVKLRWREGLPADAKAYLMASIAEAA